MEGDTKLHECDHAVHTKGGAELNPMRIFTERDGVQLDISPQVPQVDAFAAFYNDAGIGIENAGITRLPVLTARGIVAACVSAGSARIGDARSTFYDGIISVSNEIAINLGAQTGMPLREFIMRLQQHPQAI